MVAMQYTQHDWNSSTWALMLTVMVLAVTVGMVVFLAMATRDKQSPGHRRHDT